MNENKPKNIAIYGSCISKDPMTTAFNKDYKERYNCLITDQKHSFISTMQEKEEYDEEELKILPDTSGNRYITRCIKDDLDKSFLDLMVNNQIDYLILDINFEVYKGVIYFDDGKFLTNITNFDKTTHYSKLKNVSYINMFENPKEYFNLWKKYCDEFFNFLKTKCPDTKVVLAEVRALDTIQRANGSCYIEDKFTDKAKISNIYFKQLEDYIKDNFDVSVIGFRNDYVINENHRWGKFYVHYDDSYYTYFYNRLNEIVDYHELKKEYESLLNEKHELELEMAILRKELNR